MAMASLVAAAPCVSFSSLRRALPPLRSPATALARLRPTIRLASAAQPEPQRSAPPPPFLALQPQTPFSHLTKEITTFGQAVRRTFRGIKIYAMRHAKRIPRLNRPPDQRKALLRGLTTQLLRHGRIKTTLPRAKAMRRYVDKMITLAKDGSLHKRRQALAFVYDKLVVHCMFQQAPKRYADRNGGYTRIMRTFNRRGDNAPMAYIELVDWYYFHTLLSPLFFYHLHSFYLECTHYSGMHSSISTYLVVGTNFSYQASLVYSDSVC